MKIRDISFQQQMERVNCAMSYQMLKSVSNHDQLVEYSADKELNDELYQHTLLLELVLFVGTTVSFQDQFIHARNQLRSKIRVALMHKRTNLN